MDIRVIKVTEFNSEVKLTFLGHYHCCSRVPRAIALLSLLKQGSDIGAAILAIHTIGAQSAELIGSLKLGNVGVFVQLIFGRN